VCFSRRAPQKHVIGATRDDPLPMDCLCFG